VKIEIDTDFYSFKQWYKDAIWFGQRETSVTKWVGHWIFRVDRYVNYTFINFCGIPIYFHK